MDLKSAGQLGDGLFPARAARATLALNAGLCLFLVCSCPAPSRRLVAGYFRSWTLSLSQLSSFWVPPQTALGVMECEGYGVKEVPYGPSVLAALVADVQKNNTIWQYILGCECPSLKEVLNGGS